MSEGPSGARSDAARVGIDLDRLAAGYAFRPPSEASLRRADAAARRAALGPGSLVLDIGGGRGFHAARFAATGASCVVIDRSPAMARHAGANAGVDACVADARRLPISASRVDLAWFHASIHYGDWDRMLDEAVRVLKPAGRIEVWTFRVEHARSSFLSRWFPTVGAVDSIRFPDPEAIGGHLRRIGCEGVFVVSIDEQVVRRAADWEAGVTAMFVSTLQKVPDAELAAGLAGFRAAYPDPDARVGYLLRYSCISGRTPSLR